MLTESGMAQENIYILETHGIKTVHDLATLNECDVELMQVDKKQISAIMESVNIAKKLVQDPINFM